MCNNLSSMHPLKLVQTLQLITGTHKKFKVIFMKEIKAMSKVIKPFT